mgnify:CR=1 FL=1
MKELIIFVVNRHNDTMLNLESQINKIGISILLITLISCSTQNTTYNDLNQNGKMDQYENPDLTIDERVQSIIDQLVIEEKINLVTGTGMHIPESFGGLPPMEFIGDSYLIVPGAAGTTFPIDRMGIPATILADGPAGLRIQPQREADSSQTFYCTAFPVARLLASSWDVELLESVGKAMGHEVLEYGVDVLLAPGMNIHRNPLGGRNFEYYSEDPLVTGKMAAAMVNGVESQGVGTSIKHFVANNQEANRYTINTIVSNRALREIYLRPFEIAVKESQPWTVMSSYNKVNGEYTSESHDLLTRVLREDWGFEGLVMTDWLAGRNATAQLKAGNDLLMPGRPDQREQITSALENGELTEEEIDLNLTRILRYVLQTKTFNDYNHSDQPDLKANAEIARKAATEGMVLLKNDNEVLPLNDKVKNVAAFGFTSYEIITGGTGSGDVNEAYSVSLVKGLEDASFTFNNELRETYEAYIVKTKAERPPRRNWFEPQPPLPEMKVTDALVRKSLTGSDVALITIGRNSGETADVKVEDFYLHNTEKELIKKVSDIYHRNGKKVFVVLNIGSEIEVAGWRDQVDGILLAWQPGQETGHAIADVLTGKVNPSGKLTSTFPVKYEDVASVDNFPGTPADNPEEVRYEEGIYVGYRDFLTNDKPVAYEFGYGLSYTTFDYSNLTASSEEEISEQLEVSIDITNTGDVAGKEVVQLYVSAPEGKLEKPKMELRAFVKTKTLDPGESQTLSFTLLPRDLASFDEEIATWIVEAGAYTVHIAASSLDIKESKTFDLKDGLNVETVNKIFTPQ